MTVVTLEMIICQTTEATTTGTRKLLVVSSCGNWRSMMMYSVPPAMLRKAKALTAIREGLA